jgi:hypothetical protein
MLFRQIMAVYYKNHTKHINTLCGENVEFLYVKLAGAHSNHWALNSYLEIISKAMLFFAIQIA